MYDLYYCKVVLSNVWEFVELKFLINYVKM